MSETTTGSQPGAAPTGLLSDDGLAQRATEGDRRAFAAIFRRYHGDLYRYCLAIVGDAQDAHDALQNTMVKVLRALPGEMRQIRLKPWLYRIAHNESVELLRRRSANEPLGPELAVMAAGPADAAELRDRLRRLVADLKELPERQRGALVMRELAGLDFAEIGVAFDTSAAVARQTVYEARLSLRQIEEGREMSCATVTKALSDEDGRRLRRRDIQAHIRSCPRCRAFRDESESRRSDLAALAPLPAITANVLLHGVLCTRATSSTIGGLAGALGGGAGKALGTSVLVKSAATVVAVAVVGVAAGNRTGAIHFGATPQAPQAHSTEGATGSGGGDTSEAPRRAGPVQRSDSEAAVEPSPGRASGQAHLAPPPTIAAAEGEAPSRQAGGENEAETIPEGASPGGSADGSPGGPAAPGQGDAKELPAAAAHGQETAAAKQGQGQGGSHAVAKGQNGPPPNPVGAPPDAPAMPDSAGHEPPKPPTTPAPKAPQPGPSEKAEGNGKGQGGPPAGPP